MIPKQFSTISMRACLNLWNSKAPTSGCWVIKLYKKKGYERSIWVIWQIVLMELMRCSYLFIIFTLAHAL